MCLMNWWSASVIYVMPNLLSENRGSQNSSEHNVLVPDPPENSVCTVDVLFGKFHPYLINRNNQNIIIFITILSIPRFIKQFKLQTRDLNIYKFYIEERQIICKFWFVYKKSYRKQKDPWSKIITQKSKRHGQFIDIGDVAEKTEKNTQIIRHHRNKYLFIYLSPFFILLLINVLQAWTDANFTWENLNPPEYELDKIPRCYGEECLTLGYIVSGTMQPYIDSVLEHIKISNSLSDSDVLPLNVTKEQVFKHLESKPNKTQSILVFCTDSFWTINGTKIPCYADDYHMNFYTIIYNVSLNHRSPYMGNLKQAYPKDLVTIKLKKDIDQAIIKHYKKNSSIYQNFADYPNRTSRFIEGVSIFSNYGSFFLLIPFLILIVMQSSHLLHQKQKRLRIGLNIVGVTHLEYYLSEIITYAMSVAIISINFCLSGQILANNFFVNSIWWFNFLNLFINGLVLGFVSFNTMAIVAHKSMGMSLTYGFILYSISMQWIFSGGFILQLLYLDSASPIVKAVKYFFNLYPSFHFSKIFTDVVRKADYHMDTYQNRYVPGTGFYFQDLFSRQQQHFEKPFPHGYIMPSPIESFVYMILTSIIYVTTLWLCDTFIESNRGYRSQLWKRRNRKQSVYQIMSDDEQQPIVSIKNLQKTYGNDIFALRGISMDLKKGQIVGLLGQNGAGKSTLINILIGALGKSSGDVRIDGKNIDEQIISIRKVIGVCPQFDILWQQMTAAQHVQMFCRLKGFPSTQKDIKKCLDSVNLNENKNGKVSTFSGGMRRRLSLAISLIGDPKLIILDEPTTGMDAHIRILTWKLILKIRSNRTVLITTHNMQEAECLSDTIQIMSKGKLIVQGNSVDLKKKYGQGYVIKGFKDGDEVSFKCSQEELPAALQKIAKQKVQNWSLRETTLEEVFLNVNQRY